MKATPHHRRSNKVEFESNYFTRLFYISLEVPLVAKNDKSVDTRLRLPRTKTSSFELQLQLQRGTRGGEGGFPAVKRDMKTLSKVNQNWGFCFTVDSYQSLLILLNFLKGYKKVLSV